MVRNATLDPVNLAIDRSGDLLVLSSHGRNGTIYSVKSDAPDSQIMVIPATAQTPRDGANVVIPVNWWKNGEFKDRIDPDSYQYPTLAEMFAEEVAAPNRQEYVSPDGSIILPARRVFAQGPTDHRGLRFTHAFDSYGVSLADGSPNPSLR